MAIDVAAREERREALIDVVLLVNAVLLALEPRVQRVPACKG